MSDFFDKEDIVADSSTDFFDEADIVQDVEQEEPSQAEALGRGTVQGATLGFADELGAAVLAPLVKLSQYIPGTPEYQNKSLRELKYQGDAIQEQSLLDIYNELRDTAREADKKAEKAHGGTYLTGELGGGILSGILSGGTSGVGALASSGKVLGKQGLKELGKLSGKSALASGAYGAGVSEADLTKGEVGKLALDTAKEAGIGAAMGPVFPLAGRAIGKMSSKTGNKIADKLTDRFEYLEQLAGTHSRMLKTGESIIGKKAGGEVIDDLIDEVTKVAKLAKSNKDFTDKTLKEIYGEKSTFKNYINKLEDMYSQLNKKGTLSEEESVLLKSLGSKIDDLKKSRLKEGIDPELIGKKTEAEARDVLTKKRDDEIARLKSLFPTEETALNKALDKVAKSKSKAYSEAIEPQIEKLKYPLIGDAERDVLKLVDLDKDGKAIVKQLLKDNDIGPIQKLNLPSGKQELAYKKGGSIVKEEFRPDQIFDPNAKLKAQDLINKQLELSQTLEKTPTLSREYGKQIKELKDLVHGELSKESGDLYQEAMKKAQLKGSIDEMFSPDLINKLQGKKGASLIKQGRAEDSAMKELGSISGIGSNNIEGNRALNELVNQIKAQDPKMGEELLEKMKDIGFRASVNRDAQKTGLSIETIGFLKNIVLSGTESLAKVERNAGKLIGPKLSKINKMPKMVIDDLSKRADERGMKSLSNFLGKLSESNPTSRSALIFSAMQNPEMKRKLLDLIGMETEDGKDE